MKSTGLVTEFRRIVECSHAFNILTHKAFVVLDHQHMSTTITSYVFYKAPILSTPIKMHNITTLD